MSKCQTLSFKKNQIIENIAIEDMNNLGNGVCHVDGKAVFVLGGVDGDVVDIKIIKDTKDYAVARIERMRTASAHRIAPDCDSFVRCGGCAYRHITYEHELDLKARYVKNALKKVGLEPQFAPILSDRANSYRNKVQYPIGEGGKVGYFAKHSHTLVPLSDCPLQSDVFAPIVADCSAYFADHGLSAYDESTGRGLLRHLCLRTTCEKMGSRVAVCIVINGQSLPDESGFCRFITEKHPNVASITLSVNTNNTNVILGDSFRTLWGDDVIVDRLCGLDFAISAASFYQVNRRMAEKLYQRAAEYAELLDGDSVVDLFCGVGTVGMSVVKGHPECRLVGVEIVEQAVENARENARRNSVKNADFVCGDANHPALENADIVLIDPPRKGCEPELVARLADIAPRRIVYISCNPDTLARDAALFAARGYLLSEVTPADLFPRTGHVECVGKLVRSIADEK